jgi:hypothetical protein
MRKKSDLFLILEESGKLLSVDFVLTVTLNVCGLSS